MNSAGKEKLAGTIGQVIINLLARQTSTISLNWKDSTAMLTKEASVESSAENAEVEHKTTIRTSNRAKKFQQLGM